MSSNVQFDVNGKRFELKLVEVISLDVQGDRSARTRPRLVARVRPLDDGEWTRVRADGQVNFDASESALIGAEDFVKENFHIWE